MAKLPTIPEIEASYQAYKFITTSPASVYNELMRHIHKLEKRIEELEGQESSNHE